MSKLKRNLGLTMLAIPLVLAGCASSGSELQVAGADQVPGAASYATAKSHFAAGRYGLAIKAFHAAVESDPNSIETLNGLAASYDRVGRFDLSERYYRQALSLDPESSQSLNNLGYSYLLQGKFDLAAVYLREADLLAGGNDVIEANRQIAEVALKSAESVKRDAASTAPITPVETEALAAEAKVWIERTGEGEQSLRISGPRDQFASRGAVGRVSPGARFVAAGAADGRERQSNPYRGPGPGPRPSVIGIVTRPSEGILPDGGRAGSLDPLVYLLNSPQEPVIEISNGTGRQRMAARMRDYLASGGLDIAWLSNADHYNHATSTIYFQEAWRSHAKALAALMPTAVELVKNDLQRSHLRLELGGDLLDFDAQLYYSEREVANETS